MTTTEETATDTRVTFEVNAGILRDALDTVAPAMSTDPARWSLTAIRWSLSTGELVATDSYRAHYATLPSVSRPAGDAVVLIPADSVRTLIKALPKKGQYRTLTATVSRVTWTLTLEYASEIVACVTIGDASGFPLIERVVPVESAYSEHLRVSDAFRIALGNAAILAHAFTRVGGNKIERPVMLETREPGTVTLTVTGGADAPECDWTVTVSTGIGADGTFGPIMFNPAYLVDAVDAAGGGAVIDLQNSDGKPGRVRGPDGWVLLMPVRVV